MSPLYIVGQDGWCAAAARYDSPHCNARPPGAQVELLVVHNISLPAGQFGGPHVSDLFTARLDYNADPSFAGLRGMEVSAHFLVRRDGRLLQYVSCNDRAWHAGVSAYQGRANCNDFSVGVELEGSDNVAFMPVQYAVLASLAATLQLRYPLRAVAGHEHVAPGRKTDPGPCFDWVKLANLHVDLLKNDAALVLANRQLRFPFDL